jgi:hypothetical protein
MDDPEHSILSPSSSERWMDCTASVYLTRLMTRAKHAKKQKDKDAVWRDVEYFLPGQDYNTFFEQAVAWIQNPTSVYAEEGTRAHDYAEKILKGKFDPANLPEEFKCVLEYTNICNTLKNRWGGEMFIETRVPLFYYPKEKGTTDNIILGGSRTLVTDYKHGMGVTVAVEKNKQLIGYGLSALRFYEAAIEPEHDHVVEIRIVQPRIRNGEIEKVWVTTAGELEELGRPMTETANLISGAIMRTRDPLDLVFKPSEDNCRFCSLKPVCPIRAKFAVAPVVDRTEDIEATFEVMGAEADPSKLVAVSLLPPEALFKIYQNAGLIKQILAETEATLTALAMQGQAVPGTKLVLGREGNRTWKSPKEAADKLMEFIEEDEIYEPQKLVSFATVEKLLKAAGVPKDIITQIDKEFTVRSPAKTVLALESDKRIAVNSALDDLASIQNADDYAD